MLVNNAGATWGAPLAEYPSSAFDKVLDLNVKAPFLLTQAVLPLLEAAATADDPARIINIGSIDAIQVPMLETYAYSSSKAAIHQLTRHLARQLGPRHITVNAVAPGPFESKMMAETLRNFGDAIARTSPLGRIGPLRRHGRRRDLSRQPGGRVRHRRRDPRRRRHRHHQVTPGDLSGGVCGARFSSSTHASPSLLRWAAWLTTT